MDPETKKTRIDTFIKGVQLIDYMVAYRKWSGGRQGAKLVVPGKDFAQTFDFKLVLQREIGLEYDDLGDQVFEYRHNKPEEWLHYIVGDAFGLKELEKRKKIIKDFDTLRRIVGVPLEYAFHNSKMIDVRLLREAVCPLPTKKHWVKKRIRGAIVYLPTPGMKYNIGIMDTKTLYPMLIRVYNLSPDTLVTPEQLLSGKVKYSEVVKVGPMEDGTVYYFKKSPEGLLPRCVRIEMEGRERYRAMLKTLDPKSSAYDTAKILETKYKYLACSYYGVTGYENFRLFSEAVRKAITFLGREANRADRIECERNGYPVTAGDTDSLFAQLSSSFPREGKIVEEIVNRNLRRLAKSHGATLSLESKYETFCKRMVFFPKLSKKRKRRPWLHQGEIIAAKKRYCYVDEKDDLYVVGMAPRRSSTPSAVRKVMLDWITLVMLKQDTQGAIKLVRKFWDELPNYPLNTIGIPKALHKGKYTSKNPWQIGVEFMTKNYGKIFREDKKPLLIYLREYRPGTSSSSKKRKKLETVAEYKTKLMTYKGAICHVACITETETTLPKEVQERIDWNKMRQKIIKAYFESLFAALGISWDRVILGNEQVGMGRWLSSES
jgi:DNA polymerase I